MTDSELSAMLSAAAGELRRRAKAASVGREIEPGTGFVDWWELSPEDAEKRDRERTRAAIASELWTERAGTHGDKRRAKSGERTRAIFNLLTMQPRGQQMTHDEIAIKVGCSPSLALWSLNSMRSPDPENGYVRRSGRGWIARHNFTERTPSSEPDAR